MALRKVEGAIRKSHRVLHIEGGIKAEKPEAKDKKLAGEKQILLTPPAPELTRQKPLELTDPC